MRQLERPESDDHNQAQHDHQAKDVPARNTACVNEGFHTSVDTPIRNLHGVQRRYP
jgi:hypothetical protein